MLEVAVGGLMEIPLTVVVPATPPSVPAVLVRAGSVAFSDCAPENFWVVDTANVTSVSVAQLSKVVPSQSQMIGQVVPVLVVPPAPAPPELEPPELDPPELEPLVLEPPELEPPLLELLVLEPPLLELLVLEPPLLELLVLEPPLLELPVLEPPAAVVVPVLVSPPV
jgi:hypothetical protein